MVDAEMSFPPRDVWSHCSAGVQWAEKGHHCLLSLCQLPMPGDPAVVPGEVRAGGVTGSAGGLCRSQQHRAHPPPEVPVLCGQRGWSHHRSGGDHQVSAVGAVPRHHLACRAFHGAFLCLVESPGEYGAGRAVAPQSCPPPATQIAAVCSKLGQVMFLVSGFSIHTTEL